MQDWFPTLYSKVFFILGFQLTFVWAVSEIAGAVFVQLQERGHALALPRQGADPLHHPVAATSGQNNWVMLKYLVYGLLIADLAVFMVLYFWAIHQSLEIAFSMYGLWSLLDGILLGFCFQLFGRAQLTNAVALTALIAFGAYLTGVYATVTFSIVTGILFVVVTVFVVACIMSLFSSINYVSDRNWSLGWIACCLLSLLFEFQELAKLNAAHVKDWETAMRLSINIYVDLINIFLEVLDLLSKK
jgi:FtsH-binding integral membrane protein